MRVIGLDIGGANLKASDGERRSVSRSFAMWRQPERLADELRDLLGEFERPHHLAVTMTAELADCFATKAEGVDRILTSVEAAVDVPVHVWQRGGEFVSPSDARDLPMLAAAANWHALATWAGRMTPQGTALLIDMGSTTTDIIPIVDGLPATEGGTDIERLRSSELVYTGFRRTPLCAVSRLVVIGAGGIVPLAAELFATMHDVALILGDTEENSADCDTADGRPSTIDHALSRLARMLCCDRTELDDDQLLLIAGELRDTQQRQIGSALRAVIARLPRRAEDVRPPMNLLLSGEGERVLRQVIGRTPALLDCETTSLRDTLGPEHSTAACAFALARLGTERIR